jgi:hypothetical protein
MFFMEQQKCLGKILGNKTTSAIAFGKGTSDAALVWEDFGCV